MHQVRNVHLGLNQLADSLTLLDQDLQQGADAPVIRARAALMLQNVKYLQSQLVNLIYGWKEVYPTDVGEVLRELGDIRQLLDADKWLGSGTNILEAAGVSRKASELVSEGRFDEAIQLYTRLIQSSPTAHTLYVGRARAFYLAGRVDQALGDLRQALLLNPQDPGALKLRAEIMGVESVSGTPERPWLEWVKRGNDALARGEAAIALDAFNRASKLGLYAVHADRNAAMACILCGQYEEAKRHLDSSKASAVGLFMPVQYKFLYAVLTALWSEQRDSALPEYKEALTELAQSAAWLRQQAEFKWEEPLRSFVLGLSAKNLITDRVKEAIKLLDPGWSGTAQLQQQAVQ